MARAFQSLGYEFLVLLAGPGTLAPENFRMRGHKAAQKLGVFVINISDFVLAEKTIFIDYW